MRFDSFELWFIGALAWSFFWIWFMARDLCRMEKL